jgi:hypothetical protein
MHISNTNALFVWIGGIAGLCLAALLLLSSASASLAWMNGAGASPCLATTPVAGGTCIHKDDMHAEGCFARKGSSA